MKVSEIKLILIFCLGLWQVARDQIES